MTIKKILKVLLYTLSVAIIVGGISMIALLYFTKEPIYKGQPISKWIDQMAGSVNSLQGTSSNPTMSKLLNANPGIEVVPYLGNVLHRGTSNYDQFFLRTYPKLPAVVRSMMLPPNPTRDAELRYRAGLILYYLGDDSTLVIADLIYALDDRSLHVRRIAVAVLGNLNVNADIAFDALMRVSKDPVPEVRQATLQAVGLIRKNDPAFVALCGDSLTDLDYGVRLAAAKTLKNMGPDAAAAIPDLTKALKDRNHDVVVFAAQALGKIGPEAKSAVPTLQTCLEAPLPFTETSIRWALRKIQQ